MVSGLNLFKQFQPQQLNFGGNNANVNGANFRRAQEDGASGVASTQAGINAFRFSGGSPLAGSPQGVSSASGIDQLAQFRNDLQSGAIRPNLNQPALPYYSGGFSAVG